MKKLLLLGLFLLSGCAVYYGPSTGYVGVGYEVHYQTHAPFYEYPIIPPPAYCPDPYGHWVWRHRTWDWQPGF